MISFYQIIIRKQRRKICSNSPLCSQKETMRRSWNYSTPRKKPTNSGKPKSFRVRTDWWGVPVSKWTKTETASISTRNSTEYITKHLTFSIVRVILLLEALKETRSGTCRPCVKSSSMLFVLTTKKFRFGDLLPNFVKFG